MSRLTRLATGNRAVAASSFGLGMVIQNPTGSGKVKAATTSSTFVTSRDQPMYSNWDANEGVAAYLGHTFVMTCVRAIANTIANLPFQAGLDPENPTNHDPGAPLATLLGPATPQAPGGPNSTMSARGLWAQSLVQYIVTGKMGWEQSLDPQTKEIYALWPLISAALKPVPSPPGSTEWWSSFQYWTPTGRLFLKNEQVFYAWRPSIVDTRQPESVLQAARLPISLAIACDRYMDNLLKNGMVASHIVVTPPFEEEADRRAWEDQFNSEFSNVNNAGKTIHAEAENDYDTSGKMVDSAKIQVIPLAMTSVDAQLLEMVKQAKIDITVALSVPESLIGNASQRTYANADSEYRNFWTMTGLPMITEIQDAVNVALAPKLGKEVGWFDLSRVVALQPPTVFAPPAVKDMIDEGVITPVDVANILNLPALENPAEDVETAPIGEESVNSGAVGGRSGYRQVHHGMRLAENWFVVHKGVNTHTLQTGIWGVERRRERAVVNTRAIRSETPQLVIDVTAKVDEIRQRRAIDPRDAKIAELEAVIAGNRDFHFDVNELRDKDGKWSVSSSVKKVASAIGGISHTKLSSRPEYSKEADRLASVDMEHHPDSILHSNFTSSIIKAKDAQKRNQLGAAAKHLANATVSEAVLRHRGAIPMFGNSEVRGERYDVSPLGTGKNWVTKTGGLDPFIRAVAHALERAGHSESEAIQIAIGRIKDWAAGEGNVSAKTRAKAVAAAAHWEAQKTAAKAS